MHFKERAGHKLADARLQKNLKKLSEKFVTARAAAITELDDFEGTRNAAVERRNRALANLDVWLETFERNATARGARWTVRFALVCYAAAGVVMLVTPWPGPLAALVPLLYIATVWPYRAITDATAERATTGWSRFLWVNQIAGFIVTLLLIWRWFLTA